MTVHRQKKDTTSTTPSSMQEQAVPALPDQRVKLFTHDGFDHRSHGTLGKGTQVVVEVLLIEHHWG